MEECCRGLDRFRQVESRSSNDNLLDILLESIYRLVHSGTVAGTNRLLCLRSGANVEVAVTRSIFAVFAFVVLLCAASLTLHAQAGQGCTTWVTNSWQQWFATSGCPPGTIQFQVYGPFLVLCQVMATCPPGAAPIETCPDCPKAGHPISLWPPARPTSSRRTSKSLVSQVG